MSVISMYYKEYAVYKVPNNPNDQSYTAYKSKQLHCFVKNNNNNSRFQLNIIIFSSFLNLSALYCAFPVFYSNNITNGFTKDN